ncbi:MAG: hypothetical protein IKD29_09790 [Lentisphaeria bacterium]|nr:hypothetical protein [Lentisphaeria bacterium]
MMKKYIKNKHFTLIEILISMGVFLVLLTLLLNFFSGTRQVWKTLRERNEAFENSRVAMNLITDLMQCSVAVRGNIGFFISENSGEDEKYNNCTFYTHSTRNFSGTTNAADHSDLDNLHVVKLSYDEANGELLLHSQRLKDMTVAAGTAWNKRPEVTTNKKVIIPAVSGLYFKALIPVDDPNQSPNRPAVVEITLKMFDNKENRDYWHKLNVAGDAKAKEFRMAHEYVFSRVISFEDVEKPIYEVSDAAPTP